MLQNRSAPPNVIVDTVEQRTGGKRFDKLEDVISQDELKAIFERYQKVAGYHVQMTTPPPGGLGAPPFRGWGPHIPRRPWPPRTHERPPLPLHLICGGGPPPPAPLT